MDKQSQINAGRAFFRRCWFDRKRTERGRDALMSYHYQYDDKRKAFADVPYHDWASNAADAWMQLAVGHKFAAPRQPEKIHMIGYTPKEEAGLWMQ